MGAKGKGVGADDSVAVAEPGTERTVMLLRIDAIDRLCRVVLEVQGPPDADGKRPTFTFASTHGFMDRLDAAKEYETAVTTMGLPRLFDPNAPY